MSGAPPEVPKTPATPDESDAPDAAASDGGDGSDVAIVVPFVGESSPEVTVAWVARQGEAVSKDQVIWTAMLDKIDVEVTAPADGYLDIHVSSDEQVKVGAVVGYVSPRPPVVDREIEERHEALLREVAATPDDEGPRLVYADFLLEAAARGGVPPWGARLTAMRGEYIAISCALARSAAAGASDMEETPNLRQRRAMLATRVRSSLRDLVERDVRIEERDGFVAGVTAAGSWLVENHERLFARHPIEELRFTSLTGEEAARWIAMPRLEQLRVLAVQSADSDEALHILAASARWPRIARLRLGGGNAPFGASVGRPRAIARWVEGCAALVELDVDPDNAPESLAHPRLKRLRVFAERASALGWLSSARVPSLEYVWLRVDEAGELIAACAHVPPGVRELEVGGVIARGDEREVLAMIAELRNLTRVRIVYRGEVVREARAEPA